MSPGHCSPHTPWVQTIRRGHYASLFWGLAIAGGGIVPLAAIVVLGGAAHAAVIVAIALLALAGSAAWEYIWVEAGQSVPLS